MEQAYFGKELLRTNQLVKKYKSYKAVNEVSVTINKGDIYGFIGENGAGKTTFIRMLTHLIEKSSGEIEFLQEKIKIGAVSESPACYPYLSAEDNLMYYAIQNKLPNKNVRVKEVLEFVGLTDTGKKTFKDFSLGMKQRLGIGLAILNQPDFLILDEPTNGLDPQGIAEVRNIIKKLNEDYHTTLLVSSHILSELSMIASRYGIIHQGRLIREVTSAELEKECQKTVLLESIDNQKAMTLLREVGYSLLEKENTIQIQVEKEEMPEIARLLHENDLYATCLSYKEETLEEYYLKLTQ